MSQFYNYGTTTPSINHTSTSYASPSSASSGKYTLSRVTSNAHKVNKRRLPPDPSSITEPLSVDELLGIVQVLNSLSEDIETFKDKINNKLTRHAQVKRPFIGTRLLRHLFLFSLVWQIMNLLFVYFIRAHAYMEYVAAVAVMAGFQFIQFLLVLATSIKVCRKVLHKKASPLFVVQSFLSTILLFGGIYTLVHYVDPEQFKSVPVSGNHFLTAAQFLYFSTATMSTVGYGDIFPTSWVAQLIVTVQMLMSVTYTVIIFSQGLAHFNRSPYILPKRRASDEEQNPLIFAVNSS